MLVAFHGEELARITSQGRGRLGGCDRGSVGRGGRRYWRVGLCGSRCWSQYFPRTARADDQGTNQGGQQGPFHAYPHKPLYIALLRWQVEELSEIS